MMQIKFRLKGIIRPGLIMKKMRVKNARSFKKFKCALKSKYFVYYSSILWFSDENSLDKSIKSPGTVKTIKINL